LFFPPLSLSLLTLSIKTLSNFVSIPPFSLLYIHNPFSTFLFFQGRPELMYQCKSILHVLMFVRVQLVLSLSPPSGWPFWVKMCKVGHKAIHQDWFFLS
jgi:hypothetical protein